MNAPICELVRRYADGNTLRLHMPGHKGRGALGVERLDITEIKGADSLYFADGVIAESEANASLLFGCPTYYSTEGSSQCIRAMLFLAALTASASGKKPLILAGRNAHKTFIGAAALLDVGVEWLCPSGGASYLSCPIEPEALEARLSRMSERPTAVYLTSPDYLGELADVRALADVCHRYGVLLLVDNAHGAYLRFLPESLHPIDLGADMCCDSAHKTLPVITGGAYLHLSPSLPPSFADNVKRALELFGSTSPSYLILQSLDAANVILESEFPAGLAELLPRIGALRAALEARGLRTAGNEPMKLTLLPRSFGYTGDELAELLRTEHGIECEMSDPDSVVLMPSPCGGTEAIVRLSDALIALPSREAITDEAPGFLLPERVIPLREAMLSPCEAVGREECEGRILASADVACPPAVPLAVPGERLDRNVLRALEYYGIRTCRVIKKR